MKLYRYICGDFEKYGVGDGAEDAYERRSEVDPTFHYLPVTIDEVRIDGYEITVKAASVVPEDRDELKAWLTEREIPFTPQLGTDKLKELVLQHVK